MNIVCVCVRFAIMDRVDSLRNEAMDENALSNRRSNRSIKVKSSDDSVYDTSTLSKSYNLNKIKALHHKLIACDRHIITAQIKKKGQLRLKLSTTGFEVFRTAITKLYLYDVDNPHDLVKDLASRHTTVTDRSGAVVVEERIKIFNRLKNGNTGSGLKFTIETELEI